ncbi:MAG TPA: FGGY family carbohydrate kinase [Candidatus Binatia bacterium]|nr:FGGY family carbohydrate kinase [Candidatus Binatia bacterium]
MSGFVMAIDAGTTGVRAVLFDRAGHAVSSAYRELRAYYPRPQWVEQDPVELWESTRTVMGEAMHGAEASPADIAAIGITNQRSSVVAWDGPTGRPLSRLLVWQDTRTGERCAELQTLGFFITPMMAASKAEWILRNVPEAAEAAARGRLRLGMPNSFLAACLCGDVNVSDHGNASPTGMYSYFHNVWDRAPLAALGLDEAWLPRLVDSSGEIGRTRQSVFGAEVPVAGMAGDQQASLFGLACVEVGQTKCSLGTSAMITVNSGESVALGGPGTYPVVGWCYDSRTFFSLEGQVVTSGAAIQWLRDGLGVVADASQTSELAFSVADCCGVWAVPAFQGLGTPIMRAEAKAMIGGLSRGATRAHIVRAMLEGIAHRVADVADSLHEGVPAADTVRVDGGASRNDFLLQCQADLLGVRVERSSVSDGAALGAARLAGLGVGFWPREEAAHWEAQRVFEPSIGADERAHRRAEWKKRIELVLAAID